MKVLIAAAGLASLAANAAAQPHATIQFEVSSDGSAWSSATTVDQNGLVWVRGVVSHRLSFYGFASVTLEDIRFTGTNGTDTFALSEITNGTILNEAHVGSTVGNFARRFAPSGSGVPALTLIGAGTGLVRIDNATNPDTTGRVLMGQSTFAIPGGPFYQGFDPANPISVFGYVFRAGSGLGRIINVGGSITVTGSPAVPQFRFFLDASGNNTAVSLVQSLSASVTIVPAPASLALMGVGGLIAGRRRR